MRLAGLLKISVVRSVNILVIKRRDILSSEHLNILSAKILDFQSMESLIILLVRSSGSLS